MPRILGVDIPKEKAIHIALTYIYGIGRALSRRILQDAAIDFNKKAKDLTDEEVGKLASIIQAGYKIEGDLRREVQLNIRRLQEISSYRGIRHKKGLPVRGQRTRTNARIRKGPRKTVGVLKKKEDRKKAYGEGKEKE
jgi:small subunit ribosomal protein S13